MPLRPAPESLPELTVQHIHRLITGSGWFFYGDPPAFADDTAALATYRRIRPILLPWCRERLHATPWAESLLTGEPVPPGTPEPHRFTIQSCRQFLVAYYGSEGV